MQSLVVLPVLVAAASVVGGCGIGGCGLGLGLGSGAVLGVPAISKVAIASPVLAPIPVSLGAVQSHSYSSAINHGSLIGKAISPIAVSAPIISSQKIIGAPLGLGLGGLGLGGLGLGVGKVW